MLIAWVSLAIVITVVSVRYLRASLKEMSGSTVGPIFASLASALLFRTRSVVGSAIEIDDSHVCLRPYGYLWLAMRVPLTTVVCAAPMGEDEPTPSGVYGETAPRLLITLTGQRYVIFGPWNTPDADEDYRKIRELFGPLFRGDGKLRR